MKLNKVYSNPLFLNWNFNYACNFSCQHCYSRIDYKYPEQKKSEMLAIADNIIKANVFIVAFGGGEPLVSVHIFDLVKKLSDRGITTFITTNGWFTDQSFYERLKDSKLSSLYISIDSHIAEIHDDFRNKKGSFDRCIQSVKIAKAMGIDVRFSTVVSRINYDSLEGIALLADDLGVPVIQFKKFRPSGNGLMNKEKYILTQDEILFVKDYITRIDKKYNLESEVHFGVESNEKGCPCGITTLTLRPNGDVSPCSYEGAVIGNALTNDLSDLWKNSPILQNIRSGKGCLALKDNPSPLLQPHPLTK